MGAAVSAKKGRSLMNGLDAAIGEVRGGRVEHYSSFDAAKQPMSEDFNCTTVEALNEYALMKNHPERYKRYNTFDELLDEVLT